VKRRRLNRLLALQEGIGLERNRGWIDRDVEVLVDSVTPPRSHDHEADGDAGAGRPIGPMVSGRTRQHKLVHLDGGAELVGRLATVRIDHAGPYSLRGTLVRA
jgi:tRNA-2-methylthio-N6-dimethylallyladenosine synthase